MVSVIFAECQKETIYSGCLYAEHHYAECRGALYEPELRIIKRLSIISDSFSRQWRINYKVLALKDPIIQVIRHHAQI